MGFITGLKLFVRKRCADSSTSEKYRHYNGAENYQYDTEMVKMESAWKIITICVCLVPLAIWKLVEIIVWIITHIEVVIK